MEKLKSVPLVILLVILVLMLGTATKLQTARNIKLQGTVSGNANFDGSGNVTINTTQANIAIINGKLTNGEATINYPSGYTKDNCVMISFSFDNSSLSNRHWAYGNLFDSSSWAGGAIPYTISMNTSNITIETKRITLVDGTLPSVGDSNVAHNYKLILMKI